MSNLLTDSGARRVSETEVYAVDEPEFTKTWHPVSHSKVLTALENAVKTADIAIRDKQYSLNQEGLNMFGVWNLDIQHDGMNWAMGIRNSLNKKFAVGVCAGSHVMVCDNLAFTGQFVEFRKHTGSLDITELDQLAIRAIKGVTKKMHLFTEWHAQLKEFPLNETAFKVLTFESMKRHVFAPSKFTKFLECYHDENDQTEHSESLYAFHGAVTRLMREQSLFQVQRDSDRLNKIIDDYIDIHPEEAHKAGFWKSLKDKLAVFSF